MPNANPSAATAARAAKRAKKKGRLSLNRRQRLESERRKKEKEEQEAVGKEAAAAAAAAAAVGTAAEAAAAAAAFDAAVRSAAAAEASAAAAQAAAAASAPSEQHAAKCRLGNAAQADGTARPALPRRDDLAACAEAARLECEETPLRKCATAVERFCQDGKGYISVVWPGCGDNGGCDDGGYAVPELVIVAREFKEGGVREVHAARPSKDGSCAFEEWREGVEFKVDGRYALQAAKGHWLMLEVGERKRKYAALPFVKEVPKEVPKDVLEEGPKKGPKKKRVTVIEGGLCLESACA